MKKILIGIVLVGIVGVLALMFVQNKKSEMVLVCLQDRLICMEFKRTDIVAATNEGNCVVAQGTQYCNAGAFPSNQVRGEARRGCTKVRGTLSNPRPGFYECRTFSDVYSWWPFATTWKKK